MSRILNESQDIKGLQPGGQKQVVKAFHPDLGHIIVKGAKYKSITSLERAIREVKILEEIDSQYFPKQYDFEVDRKNQVFYITEEYIDGDILLNQASKFDTEEKVLQLFRELLTGMKLIWSKKGVHRDLKPQNIIIRPDLSPCIIDLGIVRMLDETSLTHSFPGMGPCTPDYASPEQLKNQKNEIDIRSDFFSLGIVILELHLGKHPFSGQVLGNQRHTHENILSSVRLKADSKEGTSGKMIELTNRLLQFYKHNRYRTPEMIFKVLDNQTPKAMKLYHQLGHNNSWNLEVFYKEDIGDGLILSPLEMSMKKVQDLPMKVKSCSIFDPQIFFPKQGEKKLSTYEYFPQTINPSFRTSDFDRLSTDIADKCVNFQDDNEFKYIVIPTRHYDSLPSNVYEKLERNYVTPFLNSIGELPFSTAPILLTVFIKPAVLLDEQKRIELLDWITKFQELAGVYLIFENNYGTKQIQDIDYLYQVLVFIDILKRNDLEVHLGYVNTESILYSCADPDSVSMGSFENLRRFGKKRFLPKEKRGGGGPARARIYSGKLFQWIDYNYIAAMRGLYPGYDHLFEETAYKHLLLQPTYKNWTITTKEPYLHYFQVFSSQIRALPEDISARRSFVKKNLTLATTLFQQIADSGVLLDLNSGGSHINSWLNALAMFEKYLDQGQNLSACFLVRVRCLTVFTLS